MSNILFDFEYKTPVRLLLHNTFAQSLHLPYAMQSIILQVGH